MGAYNDKIRTILFSGNHFLISGTLLLCLVFGVNYSAHSQEVNDSYKLSLQSSLLFALDQSYDVKIASERLKQAGYFSKEGETVYYPDIDVTVEFGREYNDPASFADSEQSGSNSNSMWDFNATLRQMIFNPSKLKEIDRRYQLETTATIENNLILEDVITETIEAYVDVWQSQSAVVAMAQALVEIKKIHDHIENAFDEGGESKMQLDYVSARLSLAEAQYQTAVATYRDSVNILTSLTGPLPKFIAMQPDELLIRDYDLEFYKMLGVKKNNELLLVDSNIKAAQIDVEKKEDEFFPTVDFVMEAGQSIDKGGEIGTVNDVSGVFQLSFNIFDGGEKEIAKQRLLSVTEELKFQREDIVTDVVKDIKSSYNEIIGNENTLYAKLDELKAYLSLRDINQKAMDAGEVNFMDIIENEENVSQSFSEIYGMQGEIYKKSYGMLRLIGALKKDKFCESC